MLVIQVYIMASKRGAGSQKIARLQRLKEEILSYVAERPECSAADSVDYLSNTRRMRNHGWTTRKVGFFIPRHMKEIKYRLDSSTGKRLYMLS